MAIDFGNPPSTTIVPAKLAHVVIRTNNKERLKSFYTQFLGAHESMGTPTMSFLTYDEEHHRLGIVEIPNTGPKVRHSWGLEHFAFTFNNITDLLFAYRQRKAAGIDPICCVNHGPTTSIYYKDPDGNFVETQVDNMKPDEANIFMKSDVAKENPFGVLFDPEDYIRRLEKGESEEEVMKYVPSPVPVQIPSVFLE